MPLCGSGWNGTCGVSANGQSGLHFTSLRPTHFTLHLSSFTLHLALFTFRASSFTLHTSLLYPHSTYFTNVIQISLKPVDSHGASADRTAYTLDFAPSSSICYYHTMMLHAYDNASYIQKTELLFFGYLAGYAYLCGDKSKRNISLNNNEHEKTFTIFSHHAAAGRVWRSMGR
jgi:hypothetical protein